jgi:acetylornithine deacetylase/succinyl-diaminopimelate desuccinylase-like protein
LPGQTPEEIRTAVEAALEGIEHEFEFLEEEGGTASPSESPLWDAIDAFVGTIEPGAMAVPTISTGFTDSHFLREALGCVAYGFSPLRADPIAAAALVHSADERITKDDLALGVDCYMQVARDIGGLG